MYLLPAIDILDGKVVRLARGDYAAVTVYNADPIEQAQSFKEQGVQWIHVVDLDGARTGLPSATALIEGIIASSGLNVEVGGGIRSLETIERYVSAGAARVVIGTRLASDPAFIREACRRYGDLICAGIDAREGEVAIEGWREGSSIAAAELVGELKGWGIQHLVYTDIARDGMQTGIDAAAYERIAASAGFPVTASGGIATLDDLRALQALGDAVVEGAITGRAIYEGSLSIAEAVALCSPSE
jgi:phosphoribosylformimino-5-aminoimidazole carboxamide ribotide isomerase